MNFNAFADLVSKAIPTINHDSAELETVAGAVAVFVAETLAGKQPFKEETHWAESVDGFVDFCVCLSDTSGKLLKKNHDLRFTLSVADNGSGKWYVLLAADDKDNGIDANYGYMEFGKDDPALEYGRIDVAVQKFMTVYEETVGNESPDRSVGVKFSEDNEKLIGMVGEKFSYVKAEVSYHKCRLLYDYETRKIYLVPEVVVAKKGSGGLDLRAFPSFDLVDGQFSSVDGHLEVLSID